MLFKFGKTKTPLCSFCKSEDETVLHLFNDCLITKNIWNQVRRFFSSKLDIPIITPQSAIFGFIESKNKNNQIINHLLLIYKLYVYKARETENLSFNSLNSYIKKVKNIEEKISESDPIHKKKFINKWGKIKNILD